jgi:hypothetical protein
MSTWENTEQNLIDHRILTYYNFRDFAFNSFRFWTKSCIAATSDIFKGKELVLWIHKLTLLFILEKYKIIF